MSISQPRENCSGCIRILVGLSFCIAGTWGLAEETESKAVASDPVLKSLNLKFSGSGLIRGLYQKTETGLKMLLPMPGKDRPAKMESDENSGIRLLTLVPEAEVKNVADSLLGRWRVVAGVMDGKDTDLFNGDEVMFDATAVRIVEKRGGSDYVGTYHQPSLNSQTQHESADGESLGSTLHKKYHAIIDESSEGEILGVSIYGLKNGKASSWPNELGDLLAQLSTLKVLTLTDFDFSDASQQLQFLVKLNLLESLDLRKTNVSDVALDHVAALSTLRVLKLEYSPELTDKCLNTIAGLSQLAELDLAFVPVTDQSIEALAALASLKKLYLYGTQITDQGVQKLPELPALEVLFVGRDEGAEISDASVGTLTARKNLLTLGIPGTRFSPNGIKTLQEQMPTCSLIGIETVQNPPILADLQMPPDTGTATGVATINGHSVELKYCFAYHTHGKPKDPLTILVTSEQVGLRDLEKALSRYGDDYTFASFMDQIRIRLRADGTAESIHVVINGKTVNDAGLHLIGTTMIRDHEIEGTAMVKGPAKSNDLVYAVDVQFKASIQTPESKPTAD